MRSLAQARDDELGALCWACLFVCSLLAGNYLVRPVRDEMGIGGGTTHLPALFAGTLLAMLVVGPLVSTRLGRPQARSGFVAVFRVLQLFLALFFVAFQMAPSGGQAWVARAFFVWASVANLVVVSIAWGLLAGLFSTDQAHRLFGFISAGGTVGAVAGSSLAGLLAVVAGPAWLLLVAVAFLEVGLLAARRLFWPESRAGAARDLDSISPDEAASHRGGEKRGRSLYLAGLGAWTLLFTATSALVYLEQARIVQASIHTPAARTAFFARIDLLVNMLGLALQVALTGRTLGLLGAGGSAALLPAVTLAGSIVLALRPTVATVQWFQVVRRAVDYAIARPSREVFYTVVGREELLRAKGLIDTAVYRAGDAAGAWTYGILGWLPGPSRAAALAVVPLSMLWIVLSLCLGRAMRRRLALRDERTGPVESEWRPSHAG
jgi:AAA family ATP:ADP antiporter